MKTIVAFTMAALATLILATAADADAQDQQCQRIRGRNGGLISVRVGTPCEILPFYGWRGYATEIIKPPRNGTALLRADGSIIYSPKPGFIGRDGMRVRRTDCDLRYSYCFTGVPYTIFVE
jgi:hypothetical protein